MPEAEGEKMETKVENLGFSWCWYCYLVVISRSHASAKPGSKCMRVLIDVPNSHVLSSLRSPPKTATLLKKANLLILIIILLVIITIITIITIIIIIVDTLNRKFPNHCILVFRPGAVRKDEDQEMQPMKPEAEFFGGGIFQSVVLLAW